MNWFRSIASLTAINGLAAAIGVANTVVLAYLFGTAREVEVYFAAVALLAADPAFPTSVDHNRPSRTNTKRSRNTRRVSGFA